MVEELLNFRIESIYEGIMAQSSFSEDSDFYFDSMMYKAEVVPYSYDPNRIFGS